MTQEEKSLLLKDLCARLPYGVKCEIDNIDEPLELESIKFKGDYFIFGNGVYERYITEIKPYLRPMSSMTEEESKEYEKLQYIWEGSNFDNIESMDWLNKKMFAYRTIDSKDMFELGLAIEAPKDMYNNIN